MKKDIYKHKERWENWKKKVKEEGKIPDISKENSDIILQYLTDMELGLNVSIKSERGKRQPNRLNTLKDRMIFLSKKFSELYGINNITHINEQQLFTLFSDMNSGAIQKERGGTYKSTDTLAKIFKAFWNWHIKVNRKKGREIPNIIEDLDTRGSKPKWVYLTEDELKKLCNMAKFEYKVLFTFLLDSGVRSPSELLNIKVSDLYENYRVLNVREEIVKRRSHGRKFSLLLCPDLLKEYIEIKELKQQDYLFDINYPATVKYLKRLIIRLFGKEGAEKISPAGKKYSEITPYDFRHNACCYWLPRYDSRSGLMWRFGWKKEDRIFYYSELLGMKDTIKQEDLIIGINKTELEKRINTLESKNDMLENEVKALKEYMKIIDELTNGIQKSVKIIQ